MSRFRQDGCHQTESSTPSSPSLFLLRPKNTSKIKRRRHPNRDIVSLVPVSLVFCIIAAKSACWYMRKHFSWKIKWKNNKLIMVKFSHCPAVFGYFYGNFQRLTISRIGNRRVLQPWIRISKKSYVFLLSFL